MSSLVPWIIQRGVQKSLHGQGVARHSKEEIVEIGRRDLQAVADYLGNKAFIAGDQPCPADTTVFAFLTSLTDAPHPSALREGGWQVTVAVQDQSVGAARLGDRS